MGKFKFTKQSLIKFYKDKTRIKNLLYKIAIILIFVYFIAQAGFYAVKIKEAVFPDEPYHLDFIEYYENGHSPFDATQTDSFKLGDTTRVYYLYHTILARVDFIHTDGNLNLILLRLISFGFVFVGLIFLFMILRELTKNRWVHVVTLFMITNTTMFAFMAGSVNYDNLQFLFTMGTIYLLLIYMRKKTINLLLLLVSLNLVASLVKVSYLSILMAQFILLLILIVFRKSYRDEALKLFKIGLKSYTTILLIAIFLISSALFAERYIKNFLAYHTFVPECGQIHTYQECEANGIFIRNRTMAQSVLDNGLDPVGIPLYVSNWIQGMAKRTYGIAGHLTIPKPENQIYPYALILVIGGLFFIRYERFKDPKDRVIFFITLFYILILMLYQNYRSYLQVGDVGIGLQGRYLFPVLPFVYYFVVKHMFRPNFQFAVKIVILITICSIFFLGGFPWFLRRVTPNWYLS